MATRFGSIGDCYRLSRPERGYTIARVWVAIIARSRR